MCKVEFFGKGGGGRNLRIYLTLTVVRRKRNIVETFYLPHVRAVPDTCNVSDQGEILANISEIQSNNSSWPRLQTNCKCVRGRTRLVRYVASVVHVIYTSNEAMNGHLHSNEFSEEHLLS